MKLGSKHIAGSIATIFVVGMLYRGYSIYYASPRALLLDSIESRQASLQLYEGDVARREKVWEQRDVVIATTLGGRVDEVEHRFRTRLYEVGVSCGLLESEIEASSKNPSAIKNPAERASKGWKRLFAEKADFAVMSGELKGVGTLDQVLRTIATMQAQRWAHRVDSISIKPIRGGESFEFRVGVWTVFFPGEEPTEHLPNVVLAPGTELAWAGIVAKNVFREPKPDEPVVVVEHMRDAEPSQGDPPEASPPFGEWKLVGVWNGANAMGVILANTQTGASRSISPGESVLGLKLVYASGERAEFEYEGKRYELLQRQTLAERRELNQPRD